ERQKHGVRLAGQITIAISPSRLTRNGLLWLSGIRKPALGTFGSSIRRGQLPRALLLMLRKIFSLFGLLMVPISFLSLTEAAWAIFTKSLRVELPMKKRFSRPLKENGPATGPGMGSM